MNTDRGDGRTENPIILHIPSDVPSYWSAEPNSNLEEVREGRDSPSLFSSHPGT